MINTEQPQLELLESILERLKEIGDLPIFSASVNRVQLVGSDPDSDAMGLAIEVLKDANLTTKVLKLANSSYYNRGVAKIGALSRAIVMLGFDTVKSTVLTMKMIESFQYEHRDIDMNSMLVNAYMSAGFVRELANECGIKDVESSYVCGLLHNLGEVVTAYTLPDKYMEMQELVSQKNLTWIEAQKKVLGIPLLKIGKRIIESWEFPDTIVNTIAPHTPSKQLTVRDKVGVNRSLASISNNIMELLYSDKPMTKRNYSQLCGELSKAVGLNNDVISKCLEKSFKQSCDLAETYGLDKKCLAPKLDSTTNDKQRDKIARQLSYYVSNQNNIPSKDADLNDDFDDDNSYDDGYDDEPSEVVEITELEIYKQQIEEPAQGGDVNALLKVLHEITGMMSNKAQLNSVFKKILEGLNLGVGFDRAIFCFLSPDHRHYSGRLASGSSSDVLKAYFEKMPVDMEHDLFSKMIMEGNELLVPDVRQGNWPKLLPHNFMEKVAVTSFIVASIRVNRRPIGLLYADKYKQKTPITPEDNRGFMQLVAQAHLALQVR